jgi:hypothetical protein
MTYTNITLFLLGIVGIVLHNLVELNKLNRSAKGRLQLKNYLKIESYSIAISVLMVFVALLIKHEITQLEAVGKWIGLGFMAIGYMGQSLLIFAMGKANKIIDKEDE